MSDQQIDFLKTYQLCRTGFFFLAVGLVPACFLNLLYLIGQLGDHRIIFWLNQMGWSDIVATTTPWATLAGSTLLWNSWNHRGWRRRAGLLMTMCLIDVGIWFLDQGDVQVFGEGAWFRHQFGNALGWAQLALLASLSGDFLTHLGLEQADESSKSTRSLAATGAVVWMLLFCEITNFQGGWPLQRNPQITIHARLLWIGEELIGAICLIQVTALAVAALRESNLAVREVEREQRVEEDQYVLPGRSNQYAEPL